MPNNKLLNIIILLSSSINISPTLSNLKDDEEGTYIELPKYGKVEFEKQSWLYLNLEDFEKGDIIKLDLVFCTLLLHYYEVPLLFSETNNYKEINKSNDETIYSNCVTEIDGYTIDHGCRFNYELKSNFNYLIIITPVFDSKFTYLIYIIAI